MKKMLPCIIAGILLLCFLSILVNPVLLNYNAYAESDCRTWKLSSTQEFNDGESLIKKLDSKGYEVIKSQNKSIKFSTTYDARINDNSKLGIASADYSMEKAGSQIYSLMKLLILSGLEVEFNGEKGLNPCVFYWDLALASNASNFSFNTVYSYNDSESYYSKYLKARYSAITLSQHKEFGTSESYTASAKVNEIKEVLDKKQYVIVKLKDNNFVLLTGYRNDATPTLLMEDNYSVEEVFTKKYELNSITDFYAFNVEGSYQSKLDFYKSSGEIPWNLILVNKTHEVTQDYIKNVKTGVSSITQASASKDSHNDYNRNEMDSRVIEYLDKLSQDYKKDTGKLIKCQSGMRSYNYQDYLFNTVYGGGSEAETYSAHPGKSEHNVGLAMDFNSEGHGADAGFATTPGFKWLKKYAVNYGFIWRYPDIEEVQAKTGYIAESWHWRFIGTEWAEKYIEFIGGKVETDADGRKFTTVYDDGSYNKKVYEEFYEEVVVPAFNKTDSNTTTETTQQTNQSLTIGSCANEFIDAPIKRLDYFMRHPVVSLSNMTVSLCQTIHNSIGTGSVGDLFGTSYLKPLTSPLVLKFYIVFATIVFFISIVYKAYLYIWGKVPTLLTLVKESYNVLRITALPLACLLALTWSLSKFNSLFLNDWYGSLISIEVAGINKITTSTTEESNEVLTNQQAVIQEDGSIKLETDGDDDKVIIGQSNTYYMTESWLQENNFIEVLDEDCYSSIMMKMPKGSDSYYTIDLETLYSTIDSSKTLASLTDTNYQYYNCDEFVPVHKDRYSSSVFYYFYDYIKYQFIHYWSNSSNRVWTRDYKKAGSELSLTPLYSLYSLNSESDIDAKMKEIMNSESLADYKKRMEFLDNQFFRNSFNGYKEMYQNSKFVYSDQYKNGQKITDEKLVNDLIGLSLLFNTNNCPVPCETFVKDWSIEFNEQELKVPTFDEWRSGDRTIEEFNLFPLLWISQADWYKEISGVYPLIDFNDSHRVKGRLYASYGRLLYDTYDSENFKTISKPTQLEQRLIKVNEKTYDSFRDFIDKMPTDINDDTVCFVLSLLATIEFNKEFTDSYPNSIDTEFIDIDKIFRLAYTDSIDRVSNQLFFTVYNKTNAFCILGLVGVEVLMAIYNVCRLALISCILLSSLWLALSYCLHKPEAVENSLKGAIMQTIILFVLNLITISVLKLFIFLSRSFTISWLLVLFTLLLFILFFIITVITLTFTVAMFKDFRSYGFNIINGMIENAKNVYDKTLLSLESNPKLKGKQKEEKKVYKRNELKFMIRKNNQTLIDDEDK